MRLSRTLVLAMMFAGIAALCGQSAAVVGEEGGAVLKVEQKAGTVANWKLKSEETVKMVEKAGETTTESNWEYTCESLAGVVVGNETKPGRETTTASDLTAGSLKSYTVNGEDKKAEKASQFETPRLPQVRAILADGFGREILSGENVPGCEAWENYVMDSARALPAAGLKEGEAVTEHILLGSDKIGTVEFKAEFKKSEDGASPNYWVVSAKISAEREGEKVTIDNYTAKYVEGQDTPGHVDYTVNIARNKKTENGEVATEITRKVNCELTEVAVVEKDALDKAASLFGLTTTALEAMSKCDLTQTNFGKTSEKLKVAATDAFWAAVLAAPRPSVVNDALYKWYLNAALFVMPAIGKAAKPALGEKWINSPGLDWRDLVGKVVVIEFWSMGCGPCKQTAPHLDQVYRNYKDKGLEVIAMTGSRTGGADEQQFANDKKLTYPIALDKPLPMFDHKGEPWVNKEGKVLMAYYTHMSYQGSYRGIPNAFIIDRKGNLRWSGHPADANFAKAIEKLLKEE